MTSIPEPVLQAAADEFLRVHEQDGSTWGDALESALQVALAAERDLWLRWMLEVEQERHYGFDRPPHISLCGDPQHINGRLLSCELDKGHGGKHLDISTWDGLVEW